MEGVPEKSPLLFLTWLSFAHTQSCQDHLSPEVSDWALSFEWSFLTSGIFIMTLLKADVEWVFLWWSWRIWLSRDWDRAEQASNLIKAAASCSLWAFSARGPVLPTSFQAFGFSQTQNTRSQASSDFSFTHKGERWPAESLWLYLRYGYRYLAFLDFLGENSSGMLSSLNWVELNISNIHPRFLQFPSSLSWNEFGLGVMELVLELGSCWIHSVGLG